MNLQDYTTEELKAELQRRQKEARMKAAAERKIQGVQYGYLRAVITYVSRGAFKDRYYKAKILDEDLAKLDASTLYHHKHGREYPLLKANFRADTTPRVGDIVLLRSRKTHREPSGFGAFCNPHIYEIIERVEG